MKFKLLFTFMFLAAFPLFSQKDNSNEYCETANEQAKADFKNGIRKVYVFGLTGDIKYCRILRDKYGIDAQSKGCLVLPELKCYSDTMERLIVQERGFGFFEKVRLETDTKSALPIGF